MLARLLFGRLLRRDVIGEMTSAAGAQTFHLPASTVVAKLVDDADIDAIALICDTCRNTVLRLPADHQPF